MFWDSITISTHFYNVLGFHSKKILYLQKQEYGRGAECL